LAWHPGGKVTVDLSEDQLLASLRELPFALTRHGYRFAAGVPCSTFHGIIQHFSATAAGAYVPAVNEGAALSLAAGAAMAGVKSVVLLQNSGLGNLVNPLTSLVTLYEIPVLVLVSARDARDGPQHRLMGDATRSLLRDLNVPVFELPRARHDLAAVLAAAEQELAAGRTAFILVPPTPFGIPGQKETPAGREPAAGLTRRRALGGISAWLTDQHVVSTTGFISRDLFGQHDRPGNFYMQGSMGHALAIGLGVAIGRPQAEVVVIDGDGALLMHLGTLSTVGAAAPANLTHIVLDNGVYESTGCQPTTAPSTRLERVARACGYRHAEVVADERELTRFLSGHRRGSGPTLVRVMISPEGEPLAGWPTDSLSAPDLRHRFSAALGAW
jgi:phosphonopyruvate decarboxylase